ncbi:uncharacterized protein LOC129232245 [Uloborus diversus]|uniref:uncharacterized protein LOC129232245 n=1 Tax=Uloborus diversus TaxID=327109 RepID=UPI0024094C7E|nr:uncharacterized protein LOC129232245 [Uloborus diversus]
MPWSPKLKMFLNSHLLFSELASSSSSNLPSTSRQEPVASSSSSVSHSPLDLLDSIMAGQKMLHSKSDNIVIGSDGSLALKNKIPQKKNSNDIKSNSSRTPMHVALIKNNKSSSSNSEKNSKTSSTSNENASKLSKPYSSPKKMPNARSKDQNSEKNVNSSSRFKNHKIDGNQFDRLKKKQQKSRDSSSEGESIDSYLEASRSRNVNSKKVCSKQVNRKSNHGKVDFQVKQEHCSTSSETCITDSSANNHSFLDLPIKKEIMSDDETNIDAWENSSMQKDISQAIKSEPYDSYIQQEKPNVPKIFSLNGEKDDVEEDSGCDFSQSLIDSSERTCPLNKNSLQICNTSKTANECNESLVNKTKNHLRIKKEVLSDDEKSLPESQEVQFLFQVQRLKKHRKSRTNNHFIHESLSIDKAISIKKEKLSEDELPNETVCNLMLTQNNSLCCAKENVIASKGQQIKVKQEILTSEDESAQIPETQMLPKVNKSSLLSEGSEACSQSIENCLIKVECNSLDDDDDLPATQMLPVKELFESKSKRGISPCESKSTDQKDKMFISKSLLSEKKFTCSTDSELPATQSYQCTDNPPRNSKKVPVSNKKHNGNSDIDSDETSLCHKTSTSKDTYDKPKIVLSNCIRDSNESSPSPGFHTDTITASTYSNETCSQDEDDILPPTQAIFGNTNIKNWSSSLKLATQGNLHHSKIKNLRKDNNNDELPPTQVSSKCSKSFTLFPESYTALNVVNVKEECTLRDTTKGKQSIYISEEDSELPPTQAVGAFTKPVCKTSMHVNSSSFPSSQHADTFTERNRKISQCENYDSSTLEDNDLPLTQATNAFLKTKNKSSDQGNYDYSMFEDENDLPPTQAIDVFTKPNCKIFKHDNGKPFLSAHDISPIHAATFTRQNNQIPQSDNHDSSSSEDNDLPPTQATSAFSKSKGTASNQDNYYCSDGDDENDLPPTQAIDVFIKPNSKTLKRGSYNSFAARDENDLPLTQDIGSFIKPKPKTSKQSTCNSFTSEDDNLPLTQASDVFLKPKHQVSNRGSNDCSTFEDEDSLPPTQAIDIFTKPNCKISKRGNSESFLSAHANDLSPTQHADTFTKQNNEMSRSDNYDSSSSSEDNDLPPTQATNVFSKSKGIASNQGNYDCSDGDDDNNLPPTQAIDVFIKPKCKTLKQSNYNSFTDGNDLPLTQHIGTFIKPKLKTSKQSKCNSFTSEDDNLPPTQASDVFLKPQHQVSSRGSTFEDENSLPPTQAIDVFTKLNCKISKNGSNGSCSSAHAGDLPPTQHTDAVTKLSHKISQCNDYDSSTSDDNDLPPTQATNAFLKPKNKISNQGSYDCSTFEDENDLSPTQAIDAFVKPEYRTSEQSDCNAFSSKDENDLLPTQDIGTFIKPKLKTSEQGISKSFTSKDDLSPTQAYSISNKLKPVSDTKDRLDSSKNDYDSHHQNVVDSSAEPKLSLENSKKTFCYSEDENELPATQRLDISEDDIDDTELPATQCVDSELNSNMSSKTAKEPSKKLKANEVSSHTAGELNREMKENALEVDMSEILSNISHAVKIVTSSCAKTDKTFDSDGTEKVASSEDCDKQAVSSEIQKSCEMEKEYQISNDAAKMLNQDESADSENLTIEQIKQKIALSENQKKSSPKQLGVHRHLPQVITSVGPKKQLVLKPTRQKTFSFLDVEKLESSSSKDSKITTDHFSNSSCSSDNNLEAFQEKDPVSFENCLEKKQLRSKSASNENNANIIDTTDSNSSLRDFNGTQIGKSWKSNANNCGDSFSQNDTEFSPTQSLEQSKLALNFSMNSGINDVKNLNSQKKKRKQNHAEHEQKSQSLPFSDDELPATQQIEHCGFFNDKMNKDCKFNIKEHSSKTLVDLSIKHRNEHLHKNDKHQKQHFPEKSMNDTDDLPATQVMETDFAHLKNSHQKITLTTTNNSNDRHLKQAGEKMPPTALNKQQRSSCSKNYFTEFENDDVSANDPDDLPATQMMGEDFAHKKNSCEKIKFIKSNNSENSFQKQSCEKSHPAAINKKQHASCSKNEFNESESDDLSANDTDDLPATQIMERDFAHSRNDRQELKFPKNNRSDNKYHKQLCEKLLPAALDKKQRDCKMNDVNDTDDLPATRKIDDIGCNNKNKFGNKQRNNVEKSNFEKSLKHVTATTIFKNKEQTAGIQSNLKSLDTRKSCRKNVDSPSSNLFHQQSDKIENNSKQSNNCDNLQQKKGACLYRSDKKENTKSRNKSQENDDELPATQEIANDKHTNKQDHKRSKKLEKCELLNENLNELPSHFSEQKSKLKRTSKETSNNKFCVSQNSENALSVPLRSDNIGKNVVKDPSFSKKRKHLSEVLEDSYGQVKDVTKRTKISAIDTFGPVCVKKEVMSPKNSFCSSETEGSGMNEYLELKKSDVLHEIKKESGSFENVRIKQEKLESSAGNDNKCLSNQEKPKNFDSPMNNNLLKLDIKIKEEPLSDDECTSINLKNQIKSPNLESQLHKNPCANRTLQNQDPFVSMLPKAQLHCKTTGDEYESENVTNPKLLKDSRKFDDKRRKTLDKNLVSDNSALKCKKDSEYSSNSNINVQNKVKKVLGNKIDVSPLIDLTSKSSSEKRKDKKTAVKDISNNIVNKECAKENLHSAKRTVIEERHSKEIKTQNDKKHKITALNGMVESGPKTKKQKLMHYIEIKKSEKSPDDCTEIKKVDKKLDLKEEIAAEIKRILKPFYVSGLITKENYKDIMRKAVPKVFLNCNKSIQPEKIKKLVLNYVSLLSS